MCTETCIHTETEEGGDKERREIFYCVGQALYIFFESQGEGEDCNKNTTDMEFHEKRHRFKRKKSLIKKKKTILKKSRWLEHLQRKAGGKE